MYNKTMLEQVKYSLLISGTSTDDFTVDACKELVEAGIKVIVFGEADLGKRFEPLLTQLKALHLASAPLQIHTVRSKHSVPDCLVKDGRMSTVEVEDLKLLSEMAPSFNFEQYQVEHAPVEGSILVRAGAGTGKTTVMVDRIVFLLATQGISPADIAMVTFTNKATLNMQKRLQRRLRDMFALTGKQCWYSRLEKMGEMQLSTLDSFFLNLIRDGGASLGYGVEAGVLGLVDAKKQVIKKALEDFFDRNRVKDVKKHYGMDVHNYVEYIYSILKMLHSRGFYRSKIYESMFGDALGSNKRVNDIFKVLVPMCEKRYGSLKVDRNGYELEEIKGELDALTEMSVPVFHNVNFKFLFVDEFQDTDGTQIRCLLRLKEMLGFQLFVVGDIKQSIYRFRGAEESAFAELEKLLGREKGKALLLKFSLRKNYRTVLGLIDRLDKVFRGMKDKGLLPYEEKPLGVKSKNGTYDVITTYSKSDFYRKFVECLRSRWEKGDAVCVLVRFNNEVSRVVEICNSEGIPYVAQVPGAFYRSEPVRDFVDFLGSVLYFDDPRKLWNVLVGPYSSARPRTEELATLQGEEVRVREYLQEVLKRCGWEAFLDDARFLPFFVFIEKALRKINPVGRYRMIKRSEGVRTDFAVRSYELNLNKLLGELYERFSGDYVTIQDVYEYLNVKAASDNSEEEIVPEIKSEDGRFPVEIMTVHKAKGLEFETVIMPFLDQSFFMNPEKDGKARKGFIEFITMEDDGVLKMGWRIPLGNNSFYQNEYYQEFQGMERESIRRDEARLLYVAVTRAKQNLILFVKRSRDDADVPVYSKWSHLISLSKEEQP